MTDDSRDEFRRRRQQYRDETLPLWQAALVQAQRAVPEQPTRDPLAIGAALSFIPDDIGHLFYPSGGGMNITGSRWSPTLPGALEIQVGDKSIDLVRPAEMEIRTYADPDWSYVWLEVGSLGVDRFYDGTSAREELCEVRPGDYRSRSVWDEGCLGYDEHDYEIPLPRAARLVTRFYEPAKFVIFANSSTYNAVPATYRGVHATVTRAEFAAEIDKLARPKPG